MPGVFLHCGREPTRGCPMGWKPLVGALGGDWMDLCMPLPPGSGSFCGWVFTNAGGIQVNGVASGRTGLVSLGLRNFRQELE